MTGVPQERIFPVACKGVPCTNTWRGRHFLASVCLQTKTGVSIGRDMKELCTSACVAYLGSRATAEKGYGKRRA